MGECNEEVLCTTVQQESVRLEAVPNILRFKTCCHNPIIGLQARAVPKRHSDRSENTNSEIGLHVLSKGMGQSYLHCAALPCFVIVTLVGMS